MAQERTFAECMSFRDSVHNPSRVRESTDQSTFLRRNPVMDHREFDRLTQRVSKAGSRRQALRAVLGAALLGASSRTAMATSSAPCKKGSRASCGGTCCPGKCFAYENCAFLCCTGADLIICGNKCCRFLNDRGERISTPCEVCEQPPPPRGAFCNSYVGGSYRRR